MTNRPSASDRIYVFPPPADTNGGGDAEFSSHATLDEALQAAAQHRGEVHGNLWIARLQSDAAAQAFKPKRAARQFYIDTHLLGADGDGTERDPWPDLPAAATGIQSLISAGELELSDGEPIVISRRYIFTATYLERKKQARERIVARILLAVSLLMVAPVIAILSYLTIMAWPSLTLEFLTLNPKDMGRAGGIWAPLIGTFCLVLISLIIAAPIGVLAGVYLNEYAKNNWLTRIINMAVVNLAGVPSIVHALFGMGAFVLAARLGQSLLAASATLAVMTLPVIITSTREALGSVPQSFRQACWNMGATRWQTIRTIVLPNSISGILTGVILQVARAAGETAPIMFTGAAICMVVDDTGWGYWFPYQLHDQVMALAMHLFTVRTQIPGVPESAQYGTAVVLIGLVLAVNSASIALRVYLRSRKKW